MHARQAGHSQSTSAKIYEPLQKYINLLRFVWPSRECFICNLASTSWETMDINTAKLNTTEEGGTVDVCQPNTFPYKDPYKYC